LKTKDKKKKKGIWYLGAKELITESRRKELQRLLPPWQRS